MRGGAGVGGERQEGMSKASQHTDLVRGLRSGGSSVDGPKGTAGASRCTATATATAALLACCLPSA